MSRSPFFLVMVPTRELAKQVEKEIVSLKSEAVNSGLHVVSVFGGASIDLQVRSLRSGANILVATPGRLIDLMNNGYVDVSMLETICLDEADEMLARGFQEDIEKILKIIDDKRTLPNPLQTLMFSATIPKWVLKISEDYMRPQKKIFDLIGKDDENNVRTSTTVEHLAL